ncbi:F0F1 ATP synthase subunit delta [Holospora curviuscula]|uniref:F0F1 ATP synthase subunit delta n=1 Tax=Holospora curviuscula TaxID=1082868 RepID=A0A2S5R7Y7_9PROT|nr:F0F1 ATP synthase subunit delta [Holospora curviuscula]PPE03235.1 F0F1 ATP synthase subunit delta [Holospora curviuscula]
MKYLAKPRFFSTVCRLYGEVLLGIPIPLLNILIKELTLVDIWFRKRPILWRLLSASPSLANMGHSILSRCKDNTGPWNSVTEKLLRLLYKEHRIFFLQDLLTYLQDRQQGLENVYITTAISLPDHILSAFVELFRNRYNVQVRIHQVQNPNLILGGVVIWRNTLIDFSLELHLRSIEQKMLHEISLEPFTS